MIIEHGNPGIAGVKSLQYLGDDALAGTGAGAVQITPTKVVAGALVAYGAYKALSISLEATLAGAAMAAGLYLWRR